MDLTKSSGRPRGRSVALLVAGLLAGTVLIQPAVAHVTRRLSHLYKHLDKRYYNVGEKVGDANTLDGLNSTAFLGANAKATDADKLDGLDSTAFVQQTDRMNSPWVIVRANGNILRQSGGWTSVRNSAGVYTVNHPNLDESVIGFADGVFYPPGEGSAPRFVTTFANDPNGFIVQSFTSGGAAVDGGFSIVAPLVLADGTKVGRALARTDGSAESRYSRTNT